MAVTPEFLFQIVGELTVENRIFRDETTDLRQQLKSKEKEIEELKKEPGGDGKE